MSVCVCLVHAMSVTCETEQLRHVLPITLILMEIDESWLNLRRTLSKAI